MRHEVNAMGKQCPIPVVMTKKVIDKATIGDEVEILVDNETAVNNLSRLANKTGCTFVSEKLEHKKYQVKMTVQTEQTGSAADEEEFVCETPHKKVTVAVISSNVMGNGDDELGKILIKGFIYALSQMDKRETTFTTCDVCIFQFLIFNIQLSWYIIYLQHLLPSRSSIKF